MKLFEGPFSSIAPLRSGLTENRVDLLLRRRRNFGLFPTRVVAIPRCSGEYLSIGSALSAGAPVARDSLVVAWREGHLEVRARLYVVVPNRKRSGRGNTGT